MTATSFVTAASIDDALAALAAGARPVAGGTDLVVGARSGKAALPESIVAIHRVAELQGIEVLEDGGLRLGALARHDEIAAAEHVRARFTALADACAIVGSHATRAQGTIGGNLMNASPAMETGGPLVCFGATVTLQSGSEPREVDVEDLWTGPGETVARDDELLVAVHVPAPAPGTGSAYLRLEYRRQMEIAVVGATAALTVDGDRVTDARIAMTALSPTIRRVPEAEAALAGSDGGAGGDRVRRRGRRRSRKADLRRPWLGRVPSRDGRRDRPARDRARARPRPRGRDVKVAATLTVNGTAYAVELEPGTNLLAAVRDAIGLTGSKEGCDDSECGACMMLLDGRPVNSCSYLALQAEGSEITTVEGLATGDALSPLQAAFLEHGGVQCGFCTPGMLVSATALLAENPAPSEDDVRIALSGNLCRCTGYDGIVKAVLAVGRG